jgi:hypothetical protein
MSQEILIAIFAGIIVFLILREVLTWYWKMNRVVTLLEQIEENTRPADIEREGPESVLHRMAHVGDEAESARSDS